MNLCGNKLQIGRDKQFNRAAPIALAVVLSFVANLSLAASDPRIVIVTPAPNTVVRPGQNVRVKIGVDSSAELAEVAITSNLFKTGIFVIIPSPPWEADIPIPSRLTGRHKLFIEAKTTDRKYHLKAAELPLLVIPDETPFHIYVDDSIDLKHDKEQIDVSALYARDIERHVSEGMLGTKYTSLNPKIAKVDADGFVTPISTGATIVVTEHKGLKAYSKVTVGDPRRDGVLPVDQTAKFSIGASDVQEDIRNNWQNVQQLIITNKANKPMPRFDLVIANLPDGVTLVDPEGETAVIKPLGSPYISPDLFEQLGYRSFVLPGESVYVLLRFHNQDGRPITYTPKIISEGQP